MPFFEAWQGRLSASVRLSEKDDFNIPIVTQGLRLLHYLFFNYFLFVAKPIVSLSIDSSGSGSNDDTGA